MMKQYRAVQAQYSDHVVLFRVGDFFEIFEEKAAAVAAALGLTLTRRGKASDGQEIPMCGIPVATLDTYIPRLVHHDFRLVVCDQVPVSSSQDAENPQYTGINKRGETFERKVVRVITAATLSEDHLLEQDTPNHLLCGYASNGPNGAAIHLAWTDITLGTIRVSTVTADQLDGTLCRLDPREILLHDQILSYPDCADILVRYGSMIRSLPAIRFELEAAKRAVVEALQAPLDTLGKFSNNQWQVVGVLVSYLHSTHANNVSNLHRVMLDTPDDRMQLDGNTVRHLELLSSFEGNRRYGLLAHWGRPVSPLGRRCAHRYLLNPLANLPMITQRQQSIGVFVSQPQATSIIRQHLEQVGDIERAIGRIHMGRWTVRDLTTLRESLGASVALHAILTPLVVAAPHEEGHIMALPTSDSGNSHNDDTITDTNNNDNDALPGYASSTPRPLARVHQQLQALRHEYNILQRALVEDPAASPSEGIVIRPGYRSDLDETRRGGAVLHQQLEELTQRYREETTIRALHIKRNDALGFFIEIPAKQAGKMSFDQFRPRQSLSSVSRFDTEELLTLGHRIDASREAAILHEDRVLQALLQELQRKRSAFIRLAQALGFLDWVTTQADLAYQRGYTCPQLDNSTALEIEGGRHPVIESVFLGNASDSADEHAHSRGHGNGQKFVANDCHLGQDLPHIWLMTGPNMAGKSTFLRQNALIALLAHCGAYVPAQRARIGLMDRILTRVGAGDNLPSGQSTFMVEMTEVASILRQASDRSLLIIDEVGRGTSTHDGLAIAWACVEYLHDSIRSRTLFATHYHELGQLVGRLHGLQAMQMEIRHVQGRLLFTHQVAPGRAERSFGIEVAALAGLPPAVIKRARHVHKVLEQQQKGEALPLLNFHPGGQGHTILAELVTLDVAHACSDHLRQLLQQWQHQLESTPPDESSGAASSSSVSWP